MAKLSIRTWIRNAAAVFSGQHDAVTRQAEQSECSRETLYQYNELGQVERRIDPNGANHVTVFDDAGRIAEEIDPIGAKQRQLATTAFAMGVSLRQVEDLLGVILPAAEIPDHSTLGHWVRAESERAGRVLEALDRACAPRVGTLALDEIFFGGDRPSSPSSRRA